jgi:hypothetical protein
MLTRGINIRSVFHWAAIIKTAKTRQKRQIKIIAETESGSLFVGLKIVTIHIKF